MNNVSSSLHRHKTPYTSQVNKMLEYALTASSLHACDEVNEPRMGSPHKTEVINVENENINETTSGMIRNDVTGL